MVVSLSLSSTRSHTITDRSTDRTTTKRTPHFYFRLRKAVKQNNTHKTKQMQFLGNNVTVDYSSVFMIRNLAVSIETLPFVGQSNRTYRNDQSRELAFKLLESRALYFSHHEQNKPSRFQFPLLFYRIRRITLRDITLPPSPHHPSKTKRERNRILLKMSCRASLENKRRLPH